MPAFPDLATGPWASLVCPVLDASTFHLSIHTAFLFFISSRCGRCVYYRKPGGWLTPMCKNLGQGFFSPWVPCQPVPCSSPLEKWGPWEPCWSVLLSSLQDSVKTSSSSYFFPPLLVGSFQNRTSTFSGGRGEDGTGGFGYTCLKGYQYTKQRNYSDIFVTLAPVSGEVFAVFQLVDFIF